MRRAVLLVLGIPFVGAAAALLYNWSAVACDVAIGVGFLALLSGWVIIGRNWHSWGYAERADDLLVTHGAMFKKLVVVPYGRMQLVDVEAGPVERLFGVVKVKLHTAAATTDARVLGLVPEDAVALRDRLRALGEARAAGL
ncbi:MAG TPA: PH domain-containing protein [Acidimicrobiales bacterium]|nr:PH domain-containing protein [Acidimicrobiales bacterium]